VCHWGEALKHLAYIQASGFPCFALPVSVKQRPEMVSRMILPLTTSVSNAGFTPMQLMNKDSGNNSLPQNPFLLNRRN